MTILIEGLAFPLNEKNKNGWGIPETEADNAIQSLKASVLKICPGEAHACDFSEDPYGRIGRIVDAWQQDNGIYVKASVTDSVAARKIKEGSWDERTWSVYADSLVDPALNEGWAKGFTAKALTLVKSPAWTQATYKVSASADEKIKIHTFSQFQIIASTEGDKIPDDPNPELETLKDQLAERDKLIEELKPKVEGIPALETQVAELTASNKKLTDELGEKTKLVASMQTDYITLDQAKQIAASAVTTYKEEQRREKAFALFASKWKELGSEVTQEECKHLSAADLEAQLEKLNKIKVSASVSPQYPSGSSGSTSTVGKWDSKKKEWVN